MTWLLVLLAWTLCAVVAAPIVGRVLRYADASASTSRGPLLRGLPSPREPLVLH